MNIYTTVTDRILKQLDQGVVPWRKTWKSGLPKSFTSGREYRLCRARHKTHATGIARRLNRFTDAQGDREERYSFEELVAEFGASFLCAHTGIIDPTNDALSASYIDGWGTVFRKDNRILLNAASAAQRAADYIRGKIAWDEETSQAA